MCISTFEIFSIKTLPGKRRTCNSNFQPFMFSNLTIVSINTLNVTIDWGDLHVHECSIYVIIYAAALSVYNIDAILCVF